MLNSPEAVTAAGAIFLEFRRKIQNGEVLSASLEKLLQQIGFTGRVSVVVNNGRILKSGYEEGYFTRRDDARFVP